MYSVHALVEDFLPITREGFTCRRECPRGREKNAVLHSSFYIRSTLPPRRRSRKRKKTKKNKNKQTNEFVATSGDGRVSPRRRAYPGERRMHVGRGRRGKARAETERGGSGGGRRCGVHAGTGPRTHGSHEHRRGGRTARFDPVAVTGVAGDLRPRAAPCVNTYPAGGRVGTNSFFVGGGTPPPEPGRPTRRRSAARQTGTSYDGSTPPAPRRPMCQRLLFYVGVVVVGGACSDPAAPPPPGTLKVAVPPPFFPGRGGAVQRKQYNIIRAPTRACVCDVYGLARRFFRTLVSSVGGSGSFFFFTYVIPRMWLR